VGGAAIITVAAVILLLKGGGRWFAGFAAVGVFLMLLVGILSVKFPQYFEAYAARKEGTQFRSHDAEVVDRVSGMLTRWYAASDAIHTSIGYGLGIMSNGSEQISDYAGSVRLTVGWGETELANVFLEGGLYLLVIWLAFKGAILWRIGTEFFGCAKVDWVFPLAFVLGYAVITALFGTLATQPPVAIWWWLSIGILIVLLGPSEEANGGIKEEEVADFKQAKRRGRSDYSKRLRRPPSN